MIKQLLLLKFKPDVEYDKISSLLERWHGLTSVENVLSVETGPNVGLDQYEHDFSHAIVTKLPNKEAIQSLQSNPTYVQLASELNDLIQQVLIFDLDVSKSAPNKKEGNKVPARNEIKVGQTVMAVEKKNYKSGQLTK